jgi:hypothetical protein
MGFKYYRKLNDSTKYVKESGMHERQCNLKGGE